MAKGKQLFNALNRNLKQKFLKNNVGATLGSPSLTERCVASDMHR